MAKDFFERINAAKNQLDNSPINWVAGLSPEDWNTILQKAKANHLIEKKIEKYKNGQISKDELVDYILELVDNQELI